MRILFLFFAFIPYFLSAQYFSTPPLLVPYTANAPEILSKAAVLIDAHTGVLLYSKNPYEEIPPASLTKLMTMHIAMSEIDAGRASWDEIVPVTVQSWARSQPPRSSLMFLAPGQIVTLRELMLGMAIPSGNDAAVAVALRFAPTVEVFASNMTSEARRMGLNVTRFTEASGISEYNMTTAEEFAFFCRQYVRLHPQALIEFHSVKEFSYPMAANVSQAFRNNPQTITQENRNNLLKTFPGVDGLKTGYIDESGYNIALTAERNQTRFILITMGADNSRNRDIDGMHLLSWAFDNFKTIRPETGDIERPRLWKGRADYVELKLAGAPDFTSPFDRANTLVIEYLIQEPLIAPLKQDAATGYLVISDEYGELNRVPLLTAREYEKGNIFKRIWHSILLLFRKQRQAI
ncbi:MAG: D-alanyl-D-alanine carboxypeptidase [Spirochaetes bacterium]|nr:D-alanyl-D-alanine carboxypeptidase [Spirochaetota bacterium]